MSERVDIREVGPRDGFQNEPERIATEDKVRLIDALAATGLKRLEVTSFVRADVIPQLADAAEVLRAIDVPDDVPSACSSPTGAASSARWTIATASTRSACSSAPPRRTTAATSTARSTSRWASSSG